MKDPQIQHGRVYKALRRQGLSSEEAEIIVKASDNEANPDSSQNLESLNYNQLMELARLRKIKGIDKMSKDEVVKAIRNQPLK